MQFFLLAYDGTDDGAAQRRTKVREAHLAAFKRLHEDGKVLTASVILDDAGAMIGSTVIYQFDSRAEFDACLAAEPYVTGDVWRDITINSARHVF